MKRVLLFFMLIAICNTGSAQKSYFNVLDYGAINDGKTINTKAIQKAVDDCAAKGGGVVYFPAGRFISGTIVLKSYVTLHLGTGAVLEGSKNLNDYPALVSKIRSYTDNYTNKSLIYGEDLKYVSLTGTGIIDGNGASFKVTSEFRKLNLFESYKIRPYMIRIINCENVVVKDLTILNSPMWVQHYMACKNVNIDGITVNSRVNHNNDGIDIDACENVRISNCDIVSGDDAIVLKSTTDRPCKNIVVTNCLLSSDCNAFKLGTESNGDFHNITLSNCIIYDTRLAAIALEMVDGGSLNNVSVSDVNMNTAGCAIFVRLGNRARTFKEDMAIPGMGSMFNVIISNIQGTNIGKTGCSITGLPSHPAMDLTLSNIRLSFKGGGTKDLVTRKIEEFPEKYPEYGMFGTLPAYGFYCRHLKGLNMNNIELSYTSAEFRPALYMEDVKDSRVSEFFAAYEEGSESLMILDNSHNVVISGCSTMKNIGALALLSKGSSKIGFTGNNILNKSKIYKTDGTVNAAEVIIK